MRLFRRKRKWPAELERRKPENAERRAQLERAHRQLLALNVQHAAERTADLESRIDRLRDIAHVIELGKDGG